MTMTRDEHLAWAKQRALEYVESGDLPSAVASMISDLSKHEAFRGPAYGVLAQLGTMELVNGAGSDAIRRWIEGFN